MIGSLWHAIEHFGGLTNGAGPWYLWWSGIAGITYVASFLRKHNCHAPWCPRIGHHTTADGLYHLCRRHHPDVPHPATHGHRLTLAHIHHEHHAAKAATCSS